MRGGPVPARALHAVWRRVGWPSTELLAGGTDIMHATNFMLPPSRRARGVVTVHDLAFLDHAEFLAPQQRSLPELVRRSVDRAAVVCTPSDAVAQQVARRLDIAAKRIVVTPLGVDRSWLDAAAPTEALRTTLGLPRRYLLFAGAAQPRTGLDVLLDALWPAHWPPRTAVTVIVTAWPPGGPTLPATPGALVPRPQSTRTGKHWTDQAPAGDTPGTNARHARDWWATRRA